jgi:hypothetical protein
MRFAPWLAGHNNQDQLEAVIACGGNGAMVSARIAAVRSPQRGVR